MHITKPGSSGNREMPYKSFVSHGLRQIFTTSLGIAVSMSTGFLFAKYLTLRDLGAWSQYNASLTFISSIVFYWSSITLPRFGRQEYIQIQSLSTTSTTRLCLTLPPLFLLFLYTSFFYTWLTNFLHINNSAPLLLLLSVCLFTLSNHLEISAFTVKRFITTQYARSFSRIVYLISAIFICFWLPQTERITWIISFFLLTETLYVGLLLSSSEIFPLFFPFKTSLERLKQMWLFCAWQIPGQIGETLITFSGIVALKHFLSLEAVGGFFLAWRIYSLIPLLLNSLNRLILPYAIDYTEGRHKFSFSDYVRLFLPSLNIVLSVLTILAAMLVLFLIEYAFADKFSNIRFPLLLFFCCIPLKVAYTARLSFANGYNEIRAVQLTNLLASFASLTLILLLVQFFGAFGVAFATLVGEVIKLYFMTRIIGKHECDLFASACRGFLTCVTGTLPLLILGFSPASALLSLCTALSVAWFEAKNLAVDIHSLQRWLSNLGLSSSSIAFAIRVLNGIRLAA